MIWSGAAVSKATEGLEAWQREDQNKSCKLMPTGLGR